jgi:tetratricopeptide (TPR) repeat protein
MLNKTNGILNNPVENSIISIISKLKLNMGIFRNRQGPIINNRDPDNDIEDFNALYEIKALDSIDPWDEEESTLKNSCETEADVHQVEQSSTPVTIISEEEIREEPATSRPDVDKEIVKTIGILHREVSENNPAFDKNTNKSEIVTRSESRSEIIIKPIKDEMSQALILNNKGVVLSRLGRYDEAIDAYDRALNINPDYSIVWNNKGVVLSRLGRYEEAIDAYDRALSINPVFSKSQITHEYKNEISA